MATLDEAQDAFSANPTLSTAQTYLDTVVEYWQDEMISDDTFGAAKAELRTWCDGAGVLLIDPRTGNVWHT